MSQKIEDLTFHDATIKPSQQERSFLPMPVLEPQKMTIYGISEEQLPEIKDWETGKDYIIVLKVTQVGNHLRGPEDDQELAADFDINQIAGYSESKE